MNLLSDRDFNLFLFLLFLSFNAFVAGDLLILADFGFDSSQFHFDFLGEDGLVLLDNGGFIVDVFVVGGDDASFAEVLEGPGVASLFHEEQLFAIPGVEVGGLDEGVDDSVLAVLACAVEAEVDAEVDGGPLGVLLLAVEADLCGGWRTLLSLIVFIWLNSLSLPSSFTICIGF